MIQWIWFFGKDKPKNWDSIVRDKDSSSITNSNLELERTNFGLEYSTKDYTPELIGVDSELFKVGFSRADSGLECTHQNSIPKSIGENFGVKVIMIGCVFIQTNELTLEGHEFTYNSKMVYTTNVEFRHPNLSIKERTIHSISPLSFQYCYIAKILSDFLLVKMKANISKEMA